MTEKEAQKCLEVKEGNTDLLHSKKPVIKLMSKQKTQKVANNTKATHWCFTWWPHAEDMETPDYLPEYMRYMKFAEEKTETTGTLHLQGYLEFHKQERRAAVTAMMGSNGAVHLEPRRGTREQARDYCGKPGKEGVIVNGIHEFGDWDAGGQGARNDLYRAIEAAKKEGIEHVKDAYGNEYVKFHRGLEKIAKKTERKWKPHVVWLWGKTGVGKSLAAAQYVEEVQKENKEWKAGWKSGNGKWFDGYDGEEILIWDEYRMNKDWADDDMLRLLDRYPLKVEIKGGYVPMLAKVIIFTSSNPPTCWIESNKDQLMRRFDEICEVKTKINWAEKGVKRFIIQ